MTVNPWTLLGDFSTESSQSGWLHDNLSRNANASYLDQFGSPATERAFRSSVPTCCYEDLLPYLNRLATGESDVLFAGRPVAYERTGGSSGGAKLLPYSQEGLLDFQHCIVPWLARTVKDYGITGRAYFSISPATRQPESVGSIPIGLPDAAYLGKQAGTILAQQSAVPLSVGNIHDVAHWRQQTIAHLKAAVDLELISVWSPTFLLRILDDIPDAQACWPKLKVISCWASGSARRYAEQLKDLLPYVAIQPKGLLSTEAVVTVPGNDGRPVLVRQGFVEFAQGSDLLLEEELELGNEYEVVVTTANGLYRYRTGDRVQFQGYARSGQAVLEFVGRDALTSDLVGEKLSEAFVSRCLESMQGFAMLVPDTFRPGYVLVSEQILTDVQLVKVEGGLMANPQYAYARKLGQLAPLRVISHRLAFSLVERTMLARGIRLGDVKPLALRTESFWIPLFEEYSP